MTTFVCLEELRCFDINAQGTNIAACDASGNVYILGLESKNNAPMIITARAYADNLFARCPVCLREHTIKHQYLGQELTCPSPVCGTRLKLNPFVIEMP